MAGNEVSAFLNYLANKENVTASIQNQALAALIFLYKHILQVEIGGTPAFSYVKKPKRLPVVLTQQKRI